MPDETEGQPQDSFKPGHASQLVQAHSDPSTPAFDGMRTGRPRPNVLTAIETFDRLTAARGDEATTFDPAFLFEAVEELFTELVKRDHMAPLMAPDYPAVKRPVARSGSPTAVQPPARFSAKVVRPVLKRARILMRRVRRRLRPPLSFPSFSEVAVSIVIPVHGKAAVTRQCLESILSVGGDIPYEVIVVDDASPDHTARMLRSMRNLRVVSLNSNVGFIRACNAGARDARGRYVVFLNNDTVVHPGWLRYLFDTAENDPRIGLVGAKLIDTKRNIQEAGGIIFNDASGWNFGRGKHPDLPEFNFVRDVDYCSGACILVPRELFSRIGGFDERFVPAYYEDTDLAFTIRSLGYRVVYQPRAVITHLEGVSHGTSTSSGIKRYQTINKEKFLEKWAETLARDHFPPGTDPARAANRQRNRRVVVVGANVPRYDRDSGSLRLYNLLQVLRSLDLPVTFICARTETIDYHADSLQQMGIEVLTGPKHAQTNLLKLGDTIQAAIVERPEIGVFYVPILRSLVPGTPIIYDSVDLHYLRLSRSAQLEPSEETLKSARRYALVESSLARLTDATIAITEDEKEILQHMAPDARIEVIPNIHEVVPVNVPYAERKGLLFVANFNHPPNVDSLRYLLEIIWPPIRSAMPNLTLRVVGRGLKESDLPTSIPQGVEQVGWVRDLEPVIDSARALIAPIRYGAGMKGKITQSMSRGLPVVTTTMGVEGMDVVSGRDLFVVDAPDEFARTVVRLYQDEHTWSEISRNSAAFIERTCSPQRARETMASILSSGTL